MILDKKIKIKINRKNIEYYKKFFENISLKDVIDVETETQLQKGSNLKVNVCCDVCNIQRYIKYQAYNKNINSCIKYPIYTCDRCSHIKLKEYNKEKYGVEYYSQHPDRNKKVIETSIEKYGVEHFSKSINFKERVSKTNLEKFGYENPFMDSERIKSIFKDKYGVHHPSQVKEFSDKIKSTNLERYGYECVLESKDVRNKIRLTNSDRYGGHPMTNDKVRYLNTIIARDRDYLSYIGNSISIFKCDIGHTFSISSESYHNRLRDNLPLCTVCYPIGNNSSIKEIELLKYIKLIYSGEVIGSYRDGLEIDIYLPELKIGFEFNGLYWHSNQYKDKDYHSNKTEYFRERGIRIIHIWEDDWDLKNDIIKSQIKNWLGLSLHKIFARKCDVIEIVDSRIVRDFLDNNHIQGYVNSTKRYGLFYNSELISVMTFDHVEGRKKLIYNEWNLSRFCNKLETIVVGGASKIFKKFLSENSPKRVISYADKNWSLGEIYPKLGFYKVNESTSDYKYLIDNKRVHKSRYRKSKLKNISESTYMKEMGIFKIYDCGKIKFEYSHILN